jgi:hypothetical protein
MATSRKRHLTEEEIGEIMSNSGSDLSSEDELLTAFDYITIDSDDEDLSRECQWHCGTFTTTISQFVGQPGLQNTISPVERTPLDYFQLFFDETMMQRVVDETNRYYLQNPVGERQHMSNWQNVTSIEMYTSSVSIPHEIGIKTFYTICTLQIMRIFQGWKSRTSYFRNTEKYKEVLRSTRKYQEVQKSAFPP